MALKALDIYKLLPKTNCKKCGSPTCLAFAMKLAQKQATLDQCPDVTDDAKAALDGAAAPPIRLVTVGTGDAKLEIGNETVLFRHDESFYHPPGIGVLIPDTLSANELTARIEAVRALSFVRVGETIRANVVAVENASGDAGTFAAAVDAVAGLGLPMVLMSDREAHLDSVCAAHAAAKPLLHAARAGTIDAMAAIAKKHGCPLAVASADLDEVAALAARAKAAGVENLVLDVTTGSLPDTLQALTAARRHALKKKVPGLGYPCMTLSRDEDSMANMAACCAFVAKYSGIVLTTLCTPETILPMLTVRQNVFTDPRKPIQVEPGLCEVGQVTPDSPLLVTTNFSLTYYTVEGEVEASRVPARIAVIDTEGTSVLTAFASDKMTAENVAAFLNSEEVQQKVSHRKVLIPGYVAVMSGALQEESGWEVLVGPREASGISKYLKTVWPAA